MLSFMISCKKSNLQSNSFVFSLIALNAKAINSFNEKNERNANERVDERTKERKNTYELRKKTNVMMKKKTYEVMMTMRRKRDQTDKRKRSKKKSKNEWKKKKKESVLIAFCSWWCDVLKTRCVFSFRKIYEECSSCFDSIRRCLRSFSSTFLRDLRFDIANVAEKTSVRTMREKKRIIVDDWWKKLKEQKSWSRSNERWWEKAFWESWRRSWRRSWKRFWKREFYEYKIR